MVVVILLVYDGPWTVIQIFRPAVRDDSIPLFDAELGFARRRADRLSVMQPGDEPTKPGLFRLIQCLDVE